MSESERYQTWVEDHANCIEDFNKLKADLAAAVEIKEAEKKILLKEINESTSGDCGAHGPRIIRLGPHIPQEAIEGCPLCAEKDADLARLRTELSEARAAVLNASGGGCAYCSFGTPQTTFGELQQHIADFENILPALKQAAEELRDELKMSEHDWVKAHGDISTCSRCGAVTQTDGSYDDFDCPDESAEMAVELDRLRARDEAAEEMAKCIDLLTPLVGEPGFHLKFQHLVRARLDFEEAGNELA